MSAPSSRKLRLEGLVFPSRTRRLPGYQIVLSRTRPFSSVAGIDPLSFACTSIWPSADFAVEWTTLGKVRLEGLVFPSRTQGPANQIVLSRSNILAPRRGGGH